MKCILIIERKKSSVLVIQGSIDDVYKVQDGD